MSLSDCIFIELAFFFGAVLLEGRMLTIGLYNMVVGLPYFIVLWQKQMLKPTHAGMLMLLTFVAYKTSVIISEKGSSPKVKATMYRIFFSYLWQTNDCYPAVVWQILIKTKCHITFAEQFSNRTPSSVKPNQSFITSSEAWFTLKLHLFKPSAPI